MAVRFSAESQAFSSTLAVPNGAYTVTWWAFISVVRPSYSTMWEPGSTTGTTNYTQIGLEGPSGTAFGVHTDTGGDINAAFTMPQGTWYCFAVTQSAAGGTFVLRYGTDPNAMTAVTMGTAAPTGTAATLRIGRSVWSSEWFSGRISSFKQWSAVLTAAEITAELFQYPAVRTAGLVRRHDFTSVSGTDQSGNGNNLSGGTGATLEADPPLISSTTAKADSDTADETETGALVASHAGTPDTAAATDVAQTPAVGFVGTPDTATATDTATVEKMVEVVIDGARVGAAGGAVGVAHEAVISGARVGAAGGTPSVSHEVTLQGARVNVPGGDASAGSTAPGGAQVVLRGGTVEVGKAGAGPNVAGIPGPPPRQRARLLAQKILTKEWISTELPVTTPEITWGLGGGVSISGVFKPEIRTLQDLGLTPWGTWIHLEEDGEIRGSAILAPTTVGKDGSLPLRAVGTMGYANRIPFRGMYSGIHVDPADVVRMLWAHIQSFPRGNLGLTVIGSTPRTVGTPARDVQFVTGEGEVVDFVAGPYQLNYWSNPNCGREIDKLSTETPFDLIERSEWTSAAKTDVRHWIEITYPQRGTRRFDLTFRAGEAVIDWADVVEPEDVYADTVYLQGKGEGPDGVRGEAAVWVDDRLRMPVVIDDKTVDSTQRADALSREELAARLSAMVEVPEIVVDATSPAARFGSYGVGDEILPQIAYPYGVVVRSWHRITQIRYFPHTGRAVLALTRRGEFRA